MWIVGHSFIARAERHPLASRASVLMGGRKVRWLGVGGMRWQELLGVLFRNEAVWGRPSWLVVHLGGNDLGRVPGLELIQQIQGDFAYIGSVWPEVRLVWSDIVPRVRWRGARDLKAIDKARKKVNWAVSRFMETEGGFAVRHPRLVAQAPQMYSLDGVHLSSRGLELFLLDIFGCVG